MLGMPYCIKREITGAGQSCSSSAALDAIINGQERRIGSQSDLDSHVNLRPTVSWLWQQGFTSIIQIPEQSNLHFASTKSLAVFTSGKRGERRETFPEQYTSLDFERAASIEIRLWYDVNTSTDIRFAIRCPLKSPHFHRNMFSHFWGNSHV